MNKGCFTLEQIENAVMKVCDSIDSQRKNVRDWEDYTEEELWFELVSCILGSRVRYETAKSCTHHLRNLGLLEISVLLGNPRSAQDKIGGELSKSKYRYPNSRSRHIVKTAIRIYRNENTTIKRILRKCHDGLEARDVLINECLGIGPKQASLFLRNISFCDDLAILDSHVIRYMELLELNKEFSDSKNKNPYFINENMLRMYSISKGKSLATLDIGIWTVMRLIQRGL